MLLANRSLWVSVNLLKEIEKCIEMYMKNKYTSLKTNFKLKNKRI